MKKFVYGVASASVLLMGAASAGDFQRYIISAPNAPIATMASAKASGSEFARLNAIYSTNLQMASDAALAGVDVNQQLANIGAISFADMSKAQVKELQSRGYDVEPVNMFYIDGMEQPFPGITNGNFEVFADTIPYGIAKVQADQIWDQASGAGVKACIIDTGLRLDHSDLASNYVTGTGTTGGSSPSDGNGHGTHVAGTVAGNLNGSGVVGVAPEASLYISRVFGSSGSTTEQAILAGLDWCVDQNTQVANMSYGGPSSSNASRRAYQAAYDAGLVMVAATGNSGARTPIGYPAAYDTTIAVGATDSNDRIASFSQRGDVIDVVAPGVNVVSASNSGGTSATRSLSGTSMATPHVTGAVASILGVSPNLSIEEVRSVLRDTADDLGAAGFDTTFGAGRINVKRAIESLGGNPDVNRPPTARFSFAADLLNVDFADGSSDADGSVVSWSWDFGDGASSSAQNPSHTYAAKGDYNVSLTVTDDDGASRTSSQTVSVTDGVAPEIEISVSRGGFWIFSYDEIRWSGAEGSQVDVYKDGSRVTRTANDGLYRNFNRSAGSTYQVCESGSTTNCSDSAN